MVGKRTRWTLVGTGQSVSGVRVETVDGQRRYSNRLI
jgi:hypothetical protein